MSARVKTCDGTMLLCVFFNIILLSTEPTSEAMLYEKRELPFLAYAQI